MALQIPNGFANVVFKWSLTGDPDVMISTVGCDFGTMTGSDQANLNDLVDSWITAFPANVMYNVWTFLGATAYVGVGGGTAVVEEPRVVVGTAPGGTVPQNCAALVKKQTMTPGRRGRGRMYIPPFNMNDTDVDSNGLLNPDYLIAIQGRVDTALNDTFPWVLLHDDVPAPMAPTPITGFVLDRRIATQRRRLR